MKVLKPIHLHTADLVQACQHFLDLFTCRSQMCDVLSSSIPVTSPRVSLIVANSVTAERLTFTGGFEVVLEDEGKSLDPSLSSSDTLIWCLRTYLLTIQLKKKMAADDEYVTYVNA